MIAGELAALPPARRAELIYAQAQSELSNRLWRAALGDSEQRDTRSRDAAPAGLTTDSLLAMLGASPTAGAPRSGDCCHCCDDDDKPGPVAPSAASPALEPAQAQSRAPRPAAQQATPIAAQAGQAQAVPISASLSGLSANAPYRAAFIAAEARTGVPAAALVAIVDAEAGKRGDGSWNPHSRNPRSSAAGLGQFLSGTWRDLAEKRGTWLNGVARQQGWLDPRGRVMPAARAELLALRYDPQAAIATVADLAKLNLDCLERDAFAVRESPETLAKAAYLGHHLGLGDARRFLGSGLDPQRARMLLAAQIGSVAADDRIGRAGGATQAHRQWLMGYIERRIRPERFA